MIELIYDIKEESFIGRANCQEKLDFEVKYISDFPEINYKSRFEDVLFFDSEEFHAYHEKNALKVYKLIFMEDEVYLGFCYVGEKNIDNKKMLFIPYSSPFSKVYFSKKAKSSDREKVYSTLVKAANNMTAGLKIMLPPDIYYKDFALDLASFMDSSFKVDYMHINNYFDLRYLEDMEGFVREQSHSYRKNLKKARNHNLKIKINKEASLEKAYRVIEKNRSEKSYPLSMSFEQIKSISSMTSSNVDSFVLRCEESDIDIAAGIVFKINENAVQVIYWGSLEEFSYMRPMELLSFEIIKYYKERGISYVDIGPSTANDKISHGLYGFKVNIGCKSNLKPVIIKI